MLKSVYALTDVINGAKNEDQATEQIMRNIADHIKKFNKWVEKTKLGKKFKLKLPLTKPKLVKIDKKLGDVFKVMNYASKAINTIHDFEDMCDANANIGAYNYHMEVLDYISNHARSGRVRRAMGAVKWVTEGNFINRIFRSVVENGAELGGEKLLEGVVKAIAKKNIYVLTIMAVRDLGDFLVGTSEDLKQQYEMIAYYEMSLAYKNLIKQRVLRAGHASCSVEEFYLAEFQKYLISLSQIEILGEAKYYEYQKSDGFLGFLFNRFSDMEGLKEELNRKIKFIREAAERLGLVHSRKMKYEIR